MELIFKALGDRHRRLLLDRLLERDGQTLGELDAAVPDMTRFGVMKHLGACPSNRL
jgi:DNA-binding transcriptional ArsR family regulator